MAVPHCILVPLSASYSMTPGREVVSVQLDGGAPRARRDISGAWARVSIQLVTTAKGWKYLQSLYIITESGALPFTIGLLMQEEDLTDHQAMFAADGGAPRLNGVDGDLRFVSCELDVEPDVPDVEAAQDFFDTYNEFGEDWSALDNFNVLVNSTLPGDLPAPGDTGSLPG